MGNFSIRQDEVPGRPEIALLRIEGEMDAQVVSEVETLVAPLLEQDGIAYIVFDMEKLIYMNSRAVGLMMNYYGILKERGRSLVLVALQEGVKDTLSLVGVTQLVPVYDTLDTFLGGLGQTA